MTTVSGKPLSKLGIGSYGVGGFGHRDMPLTDKRDDNVYIEALVHALNKGLNFSEISLGYGHGNAFPLFKEALDKSNIKREDFFLTHAYYPRDLESMRTVEDDLVSFHDIMSTDYADSTLVTQSMIMKFGEEAIYSFLHKLLDSERTRYVSLSNANPTWIRKFYTEFEESFFAHEGHLSFEVRANQDKGVFETCSELGLQNIIWRPLRKGTTHKLKWELLEELARKHNKSQSQIILNWITHLGYRPMVMSRNTTHIDENIASLEFHMSEEDYENMTDFRPKNYNPPSVSWNTEEIDDSIVILANNFEEHLDK